MQRLGDAPGRASGRTAVLQLYVMTAGLRPLDGAMSSAQKPVRSETQLDERDLIYTFVHVHLLSFISPSGGLCGERSLSKRGELDEPH